MDHPSNTKRDGLIQLQYKCSLPRKVIEISYLQEWINFVIKLATKQATLSVFRDLLATKKMNLRISLRILNSF